MEQEEFDRLVSEDVKNLISPEKADYLRMPSNQERWLRSLTKLTKNLDEQVEGLKQDEITVTKNMPSHLITEYKTESDEKRTVLRAGFAAATRPFAASCAFWISVN